MSIDKMTLDQIEWRLDWLENKIAAEQDTRKLMIWNRLYQNLIDELIRRDDELSEVR